MTPGTAFPNLPIRWANLLYANGIVNYKQLGRFLDTHAAALPWRPQDHGHIRGIGHWGWATIAPLVGYTLRVEGVGADRRLVATREAAIPK